jgi:hypothetical protein
MMLTRRSVTVSGETLLQHFAVLHLRSIHQTPAGKAAAAFPSDLITEQADDFVLNTVIMRLCDALLTFVREPEQVFLGDRFSD